MSTLYFLQLGCVRKKVLGRHIVFSAQPQTIGFVFVQVNKILPCSPFMNVSSSERANGYLSSVDVRSTIND
jgi:hypothetical protein